MNYIKLVLVATNIQSLQPFKSLKRITPMMNEIIAGDEINILG